MKDLLLTSSVLIAAVFLLRRLFSGRVCARLQYALWLLVAVRLLLPVSLAPSHMSILNLGETDAQPAPYASVAFRLEPQLPTAYSAQSGEIVNDRAPQSQHTDGDVSLNPLTLLWAAGSLSVGLWFLLSNLRFYRALRRTRHEIGRSGPTAVYLCGSLSAPCVFGLIRPAIYLNGDVLRDPKTAEFALAHEKQHIAQLDPLWAFVRALCLVLYWFNPLVWAAARFSRLDSELACDEAVVRKLGEQNRFAYGRALLALAQPRPAALASCFSLSSTLSARVRRLADRGKNFAGAVFFLLLCAVLLIACTFTAAAQTPDYMVAPCAYYDALPGENGAVQLAVWPGSEIVAAFDGEIQIIDPQPNDPDSTCRLALVGSDGMCAFYGPVAQPALQDASKASAGDLLGFVVGEEGSDDPSVLEFALKASDPETGDQSSVDPFDYLQPFSLYQFGSDVDEMISPLSCTVKIPQNASIEELREIAAGMEKELKATKLGGPVSTVWHDGINLSIFGEPSLVEVYADSSLSENLLAQDGAGAYYQGITGTDALAIPFDLQLGNGFSLCDYSLYPASDAEVQNFFIYVQWSEGSGMLIGFQVC